MTGRDGLLLTVDAPNLNYFGLFDASPNPYLVLDRALNIVGANKAYLAATKRDLKDILGRWAWDAFPTDPETLRRSIASFERVIETRQPDTMALLRFDIPRPESEGGGVEIRYWSITHTPVLNATGEVELVMQHPIDVTDLQRLREAAQASESAESSRLAPAVSGIVDRARSVHEANLRLKDEIAARQHAESLLRASEEKYRRLFANMAEGFALCALIYDAAGKPVDFVLLEANEAFYRESGLPRGLIGRPAREYLPHLEQPWLEACESVAKTGKSVRLVNRNADTQRIYDQTVFRPKPGQFAIVFRDITEIRRTQDALQESERRLALALSASGSAVWEMDVPTGIIKGENKLYTMAGYAPQELATIDDWLALVHPDDRAGLPELVADVIEGRAEKSSFEARIRTRSGDWRWNHSQAVVAARDADGRARRLVGTHTDITERKLVEQRIREVALHDPLTGLPNRALVFEYGSHLLASARRQRTHGALLFIDLDRFKPINDLYGHHVGDRVLQEVGRRLLACTRHEDLVGRLGGDEFVILLPHLDVDRRRAAIVAQHVVDRISQPFRIDALEVSLSPSVGISYHPEHAVDVSGLIHAADLAMYQAKQSGRANYQFYTPELDQHADEVYSLEARLKDALKHGRFALHYQPVIDIATGGLTGAEALVRLADGDGATVGPARFIPIAESAGLIGDIGEWVAAEACRQLRTWLGQGLRIAVAINVSPLQFRQRDFADRLGAILSETGVDPTCVQLEVTESTIMESLDEAVAILQRIKALGVKVALDDFGTGYSSLSRLSSLPLDKLKVDQSFVRQIDSDLASRAVTEAIIVLGRSLELEVIGEGIESEQALRYLQAHGCNQAQGYWFSQPLPAPQFVQWHRRRQAH